MLYIVVFLGRQHAYEQRQQGNHSPYVTHSTSSNHSVRSSLRQNSRYDRMAEQVKNVLPQVPMKIIQVDIGKRHNRKLKLESPRSFESK